MCVCVCVCVCTREKPVRKVIIVYKLKTGLLVNTDLQLAYVNLFQHVSTQITGVAVYTIYPPHFYLAG